jgi:putative ABC transport system ATP-binding protein
VKEPRVILADEPTGNLDSATGADVVSLLAGLASARGTTVVVATHDEALAAIAPRRITVRDGRASEASGAPAVVAG